MNNSSPATWTQTPPTTARLWWHWREGEGGPVIIRVTKSSVTGFTFAPEFMPGQPCKYIGGWWLPVEVPPVPVQGAEMPEASQ